MLETHIEVSPTDTSQNDDLMVGSGSMLMEKNYRSLSGNHIEKRYLLEPNQSTSRIGNFENVNKSA